MSYSFYSLVSSIKDKSSQAMATLSSDLKEFTSIVQEDVAEVASTVRKTVHEKSEALRQIAEQQQQEQESTAPSGDHDEETEGDASAEDAPGDAKPRRASLFSFGGLSLEAMGSKLLHSADEFLGSLAGNAEDESKEEGGEDKLATARRYRLLALQEDDSTYLHPPIDVETFQKWRKVLSDEELATIQEEVLAHYPTVATKLAELVPESTTAESFWANYIYKASLLAAQEQRGADLLEHALNDDDEEVGWDVESPRQGEMEENESSHREYDDDDEDGHDDARASVENRSPAEGSRGDDEDAAGRQSPATASSDGESWIELDEQRRELQTQPPLSSSSTSSFVPVAAVPDSTEGSQPPTTSQVIEGGEEEDVDWGDEEELNDAQVEQPTPSEASKKPDWGEWD